MAGKHRGMRDVFGDHGLSQTVGSDQDEIAALLDEVQSQSALDNIAIDFLRPVPIKVGHDFETSDAGALEPACQRALAAVMTFHTNDFFQDQVWRPLRFDGPGEEVIDGFGGGFQAQGAKLSAKIILRILRGHRRSPGCGVERGCSLNRIGTGQHGEGPAALRTAIVFGE